MRPNRSAAAVAMRSTAASSDTSAMTAKRLAAARLDLGDDRVHLGPVGAAVDRDGCTGVGQRERDGPADVASCEVTSWPRAGRQAWLIVTPRRAQHRRAIALALADAGAAIAVNGRANRAEVDAVVAEIESRGGKALAVMADVSDEAAVERMATAAAERFGRIDILVNNAAVRPEKPFESLSLSDWRAVHSVILEGAFLTVKAALPHLQKSGSGAIVNIGGMSAHTGAKDRAHVLAAKSGLIGFTKGLAHDLARHGITANCVSPPGRYRPRRRDAAAAAPPIEQDAHGPLHHSARDRRSRPFSRRPVCAIHHRPVAARERRRVSRVTWLSEVALPQQFFNRAPEGRIFPG